MSEDRPEQSRGWLGKLADAFNDDPRTRDDLLSDLRDAVKNNILDHEALSIIEGALQVSDMQVRDVMIPRSQMVVVEAEQTPREFLPLVISSAHSRFPVIGEHQDDVIGILLAKDLLSLVLDDNLELFDIRSKVLEATFVPESKRLNILLQDFRANRQHMAMVVDEFGGIAGLVTIEDVLEQIVGDIEDEHDIEEDEGNIRPFSENGFIVKALTPIEDFNEHFETGLSEQDFDTIGGIITQRFGHLPQKNETVSVSGFTFKVLSADNRRLRLLQVTPTEDENS